MSAEHRQGDCGDVIASLLVPSLFTHVAVTTLNALLSALLIEPMSEAQARAALGVAEWSFV